MHRRPGSTLRAAKQALPVDSSLSPAEVFQHLEILERQHDGPSAVQQRYFDAYEAALGVMEALDEALLRPEVRLSGRLVQGYWNQSAEIRIRVHATAEEVLASVQPEHALTFNAHVAQAQGLAVYGCGILAAAHVGGLRALERHGLRYGQLSTLAGVSAGSVVVTMLAIGRGATWQRSATVAPRRGRP